MFYGTAAAAGSGFNTGMADSRGLSALQHASAEAEAGSHPVKAEPAN